MELTTSEDELFELVNTEHVIAVLDGFMVSDDADLYLEELYFISRSDPKFREILLQAFDTASLGDLNELDLADFKFKLKEALANRYASQELTFLIAFVLFMSLVAYTFSPIPDTEKLFGSRIISSAMLANVMAAFIAMYRNGVIDKRVELRSRDITEGLRILNRTKYYQKYIPDYGEA